MKSLSFIFLSLLFYCNSSFSIDIYPEWFIYPKLYHDCIIGYSFHNNLPVEDAVYMFCLYKYCKVVGSTKNTDISSKDYFKNIELYYFSDDYYYIIDSKQIDSIKNKLVYIDGFCNDVLSKGFVQLFTLEKDFKFEKKEIDIRNIPEPDWAAKTFWLDNNYYYGVGMFSAIHNENEAWKRSEEKAIYSVFSSIQVNITTKTVLGQNNNSAFLLNAIKTDFAYEIKNIEPLERWLDTENEMFYTLVRINKNDISIYIEKK